MSLCMWTIDKGKGRRRRRRRRREGGEFSC
jgi:hypothetical protein